MLLFEGQANRTQTLVPRSLINSESNMQVEMSENMMEARGRNSQRTEEKHKEGSVFK